LPLEAVHHSLTFWEKVLSNLVTDKGVDFTFFPQNSKKGLDCLKGNAHFVVTICDWSRLVDDQIERKKG
jgi:hypothetical protein